MESNYVNLGQCSTKKEVVYTQKGMFQNVGYTVLTPSCGGNVQNIDFTEVVPVGYVFVVMVLFTIFMFFKLVLSLNN